LFASGDRRAELLRQYTVLHAEKSLSNDKLKAMAVQWFELQDERNTLLKKYYGQVEEKMSPTHAAQFVQIEHRFNLIIDLLVASEVPLIEKQPATRPATQPVDVKARP
jgi:hypothetical protein